MAWIYLAESEGSAMHSNLGSEQSPIVKDTDTLKVYCCPGCNQETLIEPQSGMMSPRSLEICSQKLTSSLEDFPAKTSVRPALELAWKESEVDFFSKSSDSLASYDQDSFSWKTSQLSLFGGLTGFAWSSLRWGMIVGGRLFQPRSLEPVTRETAGSYLPTPMVSQKTYDNQKNGKRTSSLYGMALRGVLPTPMARDWKGSGGANRESPDLAFTMGGSLNPQFVEELMGYNIETTALSASVIPWFQSKRVKRSKGCAV